MMRAPAIVAVTVAALVLSLAVAVGAGPSESRYAIAHDSSTRTLTVSASFSSVTRLTQADGAVALSMPGLQCTLEAGMPAVPVKTFRVALPRGARLADLAFDESGATVTKGVVQVAGSQVPFSRRPSRRPAGQSAQPARLPAAAYPARRVQYTVQYLHHVPVVILDVYPVQVAPDAGTYTAVADVRVTLRYEADPALQGVRDMFAHEATRVSEFVDNPEILTRERLAARDNASGYDYLIISSDQFISFTGQGGFQDFQDNLQSRSLRSKIVDVATIDAGVQGKDRADKIRNFIRQEYEHGGIRYVLLAADGDESGSGCVIPARRLWSKIRSYDGSWSITEENIPADLYYSCLDGDFDGNGNGVWGEPTDGPNGGDVDMLAEVSVGRWPMKSTDDLVHLVHKTITASSRAQPRKVLMMGEALFPEMNLYGDDYMNQLVGTCTDHGFQTTGYSADWGVDHLYDRTGEWSGSKALSTISGGDFTMINHVGHSNTGYNMRLYSSQIRRMANQRPFFYYTQGCFPGDFTADDCFIEYLVRSEHGAVAAVANTCYGLGPEDPDPSSTQTPGASQMLHRRFIDAVFSASSPTLGRANALSKEAFIGLASAQEIRWVMWDANFFGDPSLRFSY